MAHSAILPSRARAGGPARRTGGQAESQKAFARATFQQSGKSGDPPKLLKRRGYFCVQFAREELLPEGGLNGGVATPTAKAFVKKKVQGKMNGKK